MAVYIQPVHGPAAVDNNRRGKIGYDRPESSSANLKFSIPVNQFKYSGYYIDPESGFYLLKTRFYATAYCIFTSRDISDLPNRYSYCRNNPVNKTDPEGTDSSDWMWAAPAIAAAPLVLECCILAADRFLTLRAMKTLHWPAFRKMAQKADFRCAAGELGMPFRPFPELLGPAGQDTVSKMNSPFKTGLTSMSAAAPRVCSRKERTPGLRQRRFVRTVVVDEQTDVRHDIFSLLSPPPKDIYPDNPFSRDSLNRMKYIPLSIPR